MRKQKVKSWFLFVGPVIMNLKVKSFNLAFYLILTSFIVTHMGKNNNNFTLNTTDTEIGSNWKLLFYRYKQSEQSNRALVRKNWLLPFENQSLLTRPKGCHRVIWEEKRPSLYSRTDAWRGRVCIIHLSTWMGPGGARWAPVCMLGAPRSIDRSVPGRHRSISKGQKSDALDWISNDGSFSRRSKEADKNSSFFFVWCVPQPE